VQGLCLERWAVDQRVMVRGNWHTVAWTGEQREVRPI
jgi:hypothetical protein